MIRDDVEAIVIVPVLPHYQQRSSKQRRELLRSLAWVSHEHIVAQLELLGPSRGLDLLPLGLLMELRGGDDVVELLVELLDVLVDRGRRILAADCIDVHVGENSAVHSEKVAEEKAHGAGSDAPMVRGIDDPLHQRQVNAPAAQNLLVHDDGAKMLKNFPDSSAQRCRWLEVGTAD